MKKFFSFMTAIMLAVFVMNATNVESSKFFDNTSVTLRGGASALMHPGCSGYENFGHTIQASGSLQFEKWITPAFGVSVEGTVGFTNGSKFGVYQSKNWLNYVTVMAQSKVNLANLFLGYNGEPRKWEFIPTVGIGWVHGFDKGSDQNSLGTKYAFDIRYNTSKKFSIVATPYIAYRFTTEGHETQPQPRFDSRNAWWGLEFGVSYRFGKTFTLCPYKYTQSDVDALNSQINDLRSREPQVVTKEVTKTDTIVPSQYVVFFDESSVELTPTGKAILDGVSVNKVALVQGSASPDGPKKLNETLAADRADVVKTYLENRGVKVLKSEGVSTMYNSRVVVITVK